MALRRLNNAMVLRARALRREMTLPEGVLWQVLRRRPDGFKFRRQHPIGRSIVDFYCPATRLVIEIDGEAHNVPERAARDVRRDAWLKSQGFGVMRFPAPDLLKDIGSVLAEILAACEGSLPLHQASPGSPPHGFAAGRK